ncbi:MAG: NPCBM/NEW2 domain-containing protein [Alloprevotella sp.]|nr:NPCBM/NEW2 domain-containing protein [Alloprevotella sp.]
MMLNAQDVGVSIGTPRLVEMSALPGLEKISCFNDKGKTKTRANKSTFDENIVVKDTTYASGVGTHAPSKAFFKINGATRFVASLGIDDHAEKNKDNHGVVDFEIKLYKGTAAETYRTGTITRQDPSTYKLNIPLAGYDYLELNLDKGTREWADEVDWADAFFIVRGAEASNPEIITEEEIVEPGGGDEPQEPVIVNLPEEGEDGAEIIALSSLDLSNMVTGWGTIRADKSIGNNPLKLRGVEYTSGLGVHANSQIVIKLNGSVTKFHAVCGTDDEADNPNKPNEDGAMDWNVTLIGEGGVSKIAASGSCSKNTDATEVEVDCTGGWKYLVLNVDKGANNYSDHFDWANAYFEYVEQNSTPPASVSPEALESKLDCATTYFSTPGVKMMQFLRATDPDAVITVSGLPEGLEYNAARQAVVGTVATAGEYTYNVTVNGSDEPVEVKLIVSDDLQMPTPMMGWLSWNVVEGSISTQVVKDVADAMVANGLGELGYNALMIDDKWHATTRNDDGTPKEDPAKFPNGMKEAADYVHEKGLKFGIYSDAGNRTCGGMFGSYDSETVDAQQYAAWGVDILKYDYCNAPGDLVTCRGRYNTMADALKASGRDITLYICEWGVREPWKWGAEIGSPVWRATYDTRDYWTSSQGVGIVQSINGMKNLWPYSGPNRFNDADMMCVGIHGSGKSSNAYAPVTPNPGMSQDEYATQMSLWCMWASPLTLSFDLRNEISDEDMAIIGNEELIAINQDPMGLQAQYLGENSGLQLYAKDLENGDVALAVVNLNDAASSHTIDFSAVPALDASATYNVRDCWSHSDLDPQTSSFVIDNIPSHATKVYRLSTKSDKEDPGEEENPSDDDKGDVIVGIDGVGADGVSSLSAVPANGQVSVTYTHSAGQSKRIIISDMAGRVVGSATGSAETISVPVNAPAGSVVMVRAVAAGKAMSAKVVL